VSACIPHGGYQIHLCDLGFSSNPCSMLSDFIFSLLQGVLFITGLNTAEFFYILQFKFPYIINGPPDSLNAGVVYDTAVF
jgi:hypothetical protein